MPEYKEGTREKYKRKIAVCFLSLSLSGFLLLGLAVLCTIRCYCVNASVRRLAEREREKELEKISAIGLEDFVDFNEN